MKRSAADHVAMVATIIDHIETHLDENLCLATLSNVAGVSPYHFHRIFTRLTGETPCAFINRLRLERAAAGLVVARQASVTDIAFACGFNDSATFARAFRKNFRQNASTWKRSKNSKIDQDSLAGTFYILRQKALPEPIAIRPLKVEVIQMQEQRLRYVRHTGAYQHDTQLFARLYHSLCELEPRACHPASEIRVIYHDPLGITPTYRLRISLAVATQAQGADCLTIPEGRYLVCRHKPLNPEQQTLAWVEAYGKIMPRYGLKPDPRPCFELYRRAAGTVTDFDICIAVGDTGGNLRHAKETL